MMYAASYASVGYGFVPSVFSEVCFLDLEECTDSSGLFDFGEGLFGGDAVEDEVLRVGAFGFLGVNLEHRFVSVRFNLDVVSIKFFD